MAILSHFRYYLSQVIKTLEENFNGLLKFFAILLLNFNSEWIQTKVELRDDVDDADDTRESSGPASSL